MDWVDKMNATISYIEDNLMGDIEPLAIARIAGCSYYHFQRVFLYMANISLNEYIRCRRLTQSAYLLQNEGAKVIDVALSCGYDSPTAFTRAFQLFHGMTPSQAKRAGKPFTAYLPLSFQISIQGVTPMNYSIINKEAFRVVGPKLHTTTENDRNIAEIPAFWAEEASKGTIEKLCAMNNTDFQAVLGVCSGNFATSMEFDYFIAVPSTLPVPEGYDELIIPSAQWAVFECIGPMPHSIQQLTKRIFAEWLPSSGYSLSDTPDIEVYYEGDNTKADYKSEVWAPVVKKQPWATNM